MIIKILQDEGTHVVGNRVTGKLADAEIHFVTGPLAGLKLIGFGIWETRGTPGIAANVTFPARQYSVNGERRSFALLRPIVDATAQSTIKTLILDAYNATQAIPEIVVDVPPSKDRPF